MTLGSPDSNEIGRYAESTSLSTTISALLNLALASVSAAFTKYVRTRTVYKQGATNLPTSTSFQNFTLFTNVIGSAFTRSGNVYTCAKAGEYRVLFAVSYAGNVNGNRGVRLVGSGGLGDRNCLIASLNATLPQTVMLEWLVTLAVGDTITTQALQNSGSTLSVQGHLIFDEVV